MYTYVNVYYGLSKAPEHRFFSLEDAIKGLKEIYAKDPFFIDDIKFEEAETVQWKKSVVDENGKENFVPYDVQIRHIKVFLLRKRYEPKNAKDAAKQFAKLIADKELQATMRERMARQLAIYGDYDAHFNAIKDYLLKVAKKQI